MDKTLSVVLFIWVDNDPRSQRKWYRDLGNALDSLDQQTVRADEIIVVNAGPSEENTARIKKVVEEHDTVTHIEIPTPEFNMSWGYNVGVKQAKFEYIMAVGYEMIASPRAIESVKALMQPDRHIGGCCGWLSRDADLSDPVADWDKLCAPLEYKMGRENNFGTTSGTIHVMHRDQWHRLRGYNEDFPFYGAGAGLALRAQRGGMKSISVLCEDAMWLHPWHEHSRLVFASPSTYKFDESPVVCNPDGWGEVS